MPASAALLEKYPDVDGYLLAKWEKVFLNFFDTNATGNLDWGDCYLVTRKVRDVYGADSEQMQLAKTKLKKLWDEMLAASDDNNDKKISIKEWIKVLKSHDVKNNDQWYLDYCTFMFKLFDVSADNYLDIAEYADGMSLYGFDESAAHAAFKKFAFDKNGKAVNQIDFTTFRHHWDEYFYGSDKNSPGAHLFGEFSG